MKIVAKKDSLEFRYTTIKNRDDFATSPDDLEDGSVAEYRRLKIIVAANMLQHLLNPRME